MNDLSFLINNPEIAKDIRLDVSGEDLLYFANTLIGIAKKEGEKEAARKENNRLVDREEAARILGASLPTLWRWNEKKILTHRKIGKKVYYRFNDIQKILGEK